MVQRGRGAILNTASIAANMPVPGLATYSATKAFVLVLSEALSAELKGTGVSVSTLQPNATRTQIGDTAGVPIEITGIPLRLWADPDAVAREGVDAMLSGRRHIAAGGPHYRALRPLFRHMPRAALLAVSGRLMRSR
jgi:short-subunit dehydrogenase